MVSLTKAEKQKLKEILTKFKDRETKQILNKISNEKKRKYIKDHDKIRELLDKSFKLRRKVKILQSACR